MLQVINIVIVFVISTMNDVDFYFVRFMYSILSCLGWLTSNLSNLSKLLMRFQCIFHSFQHQK